jgi:hypothetical protein
MTDENQITDEQRKRLDEVSASTTHYYDSIGEEEHAEISDWGDIAAASLAQMDWRPK